jgi:hypothetical protein
MSNPAQTALSSAGARIGRWIVTAIPSGWVWIAGFGIQKQIQGVVPSNVCLKEDELLAGNLELYIRAQITLMKRTFLEPMIAGPAPLAFPDAQEAAMLMVKHQPLNGTTVFQVQHYVRSANWIGIATLTTVEPELLKVRPEFEQFMKLLRIELRT